LAISDFVFGVVAVGGTLSLFGMMGGDRSDAKQVTRVTAFHGK
jgi:hypothetical protein